MEEENHSNTETLLLVLLVLLAGGAVALWYLVPERGVGYAPTQPIPFSHKLHAGDKRIDCRYCHSSVERSSHSNVPSVDVCMNCHLVVRPDSPHVQKLMTAFMNKKPIQWTNVHVLPDYVYFNHERHVAAQVKCNTCHGHVAGMEKVSQVETLKMGWCINCHREQKPPAPTDCNSCHR